MGLNVSLEDMKQAVVDEHMRPQIRQQWREHEVSHEPHDFEIALLRPSTTLYTNISITYFFTTKCFRGSHPFFSNLNKCSYVNVIHHL